MAELPFPITAIRLPDEEKDGSQAAECMSEPLKSWRPVIDGQRHFDRNPTALTRTSQVSSMIPDFVSSLRFHLPWASSNSAWETRWPHLTSRARSYFATVFLKYSRISPPEA